MTKETGLADTLYDWGESVANGDDQVGSFGARQMCTSILLTDKDIHIETVRELADALDIEPVNMVWLGGEALAEDTHGVDFKWWCLCPIEIEATLKHCGYTGGWSETGDPMCFVAGPVTNGDNQ
jgi:hypothetical protein